ncbi:MAG: hypothetical protein HC769_19505 [Cyanobacteria bacterium CRU_2_1]|nr:hypothetical protein [Cyanobacteria bacterium RU_5_0]NJR60813.1 hypothetical protein [Cyanobacteria bacterium CRU_2_1]
MPRQPSEAAAFLDIYKLVIEKKRLRQELQSIDQRRQQILDRLASLEVQVSELETTAHYLRETTTSDAPIHASISIAAHAKPQPSTDSLEGFETLFLEY